MILYIYSSHCIVLILLFKIVSFIIPYLNWLASLSDHFSVFILLQPGPVIMLLPSLTGSTMIFEICPEPGTQVFTTKEHEVQHKGTQIPIRGLSGWNCDQLLSSRNFSSSFINIRISFIVSGLDTKYKNDYETHMIDKIINWYETDD